VGTSRQARTFRFERAFDDLFGAGFVLRQKEHADTEEGVVGQGEAAGFEQQRAGHVRHEADAVAGGAVSGYGAAVFEAGERGEGLFKNVVSCVSRDRSYKTYTAGVLIEAGID